MKYAIFIISAILITFSSCINEKETIKTIDLSNPGKKTDLHLEDLLEDMQLIKLEMKKDEPLPQYISLWLGNKYLIIFSGEAVYQYTTEGKYVRTLMIRGNGPDEYNYIDCFDVNEKTDRLYFADQMKTGKIFVIDLLTGKILDPIQTPYDVSLLYEGLKIFSDNTLLCFNSHYHHTTRLFYYLDLDGKETPGARRDSILTEGASAGRSAYLRKVGDEFHYMGNKNDTLYRVSGDKLIPGYVLRTGDRFDDTENMEEMLPSILLEGSNKIVLRNTEIIVQRFGDAGIRMQSGKQSLFVFDKKDNELFEVGKVRIDLLEHERENLPLMVSGNYGMLVLEALDFKKIAEDIIAYSKNEELINEIKEINASLSEEDNPLLLYGKIR